MPRLPRHEEKFPEFRKRSAPVEIPHITGIACAKNPLFQKTRHRDVENVQKKIANP
jgi:hypothetical protein